MPRDDKTGEALLYPDSLRPDADPGVVHAACMAAGGIDLASAFHAHLRAHCEGKTGKGLCSLRGATADGLCPASYQVCPSGPRAANPPALADVALSADEQAELALKANPVPPVPRAPVKPGKLGK